MHPVFDSIRNKDLEKTSKVRVKLQFDKDKYYRDLEKDGRESPLVKNMLLKQIVKEANLYQKS